MKLIGRKVKGFKFKSDVVHFVLSMEEYIGKAGEIVDMEKHTVKVRFRGGRIWNYPLDKIEEHLVPEYEIGKEYEFSDDGKCWDGPMKLVAIINHEYKYVIDNGGGYFNGYKQIREIKPKVKELTLEEIAEKFGCDVSEIKIKK